MPITINGKIIENKPHRRSGNEVITTGDVSYIVYYNSDKTPSGYTIVDTKDLPLLMKYRWSKQGRPGHDYIHTALRVENGKYKWTTLQHLLLPKLKGFSVDHINRNRFDNRRSNLRYATPTEQAYNRKTYYGRGYFYHKTNKAWYAYMGGGRKKKQKLYGPFKTERKAATCRADLLRKIPLVYSTISPERPIPMI